MTSAEKRGNPPASDQTRNQHPQTTFADSEAALEQLRTSETRYRRLFETAQDGILLLDAKTGQITDVNPFMVAMLGYPREHFVGRRLWEIGPVKDEQLSRQAFLQLQEKRYVRYEDLPLETFDGGRVQVEFVSNVYTVGDDEVIQCNIRDISARKLAEMTQRETSRKIAELHRAAHDLEISEVEEDVYRMAVDAAERVLGFPACSLYVVVEGMLVVTAISSEAAATMGERLPIRGEQGGLAAETLRTREPVHFGSAEDAPESCLAQPSLQSGISVPVGSLGVFQVHSAERNAFSEEDVQLLELLAGYTVEAMRRIRLQQDLEERATRDPLTGVYNRRYFVEVISQEMSRSKRHDRPIGFLMIDINRFKQINDQLGHLAGDNILLEVGTLLQEAVRGEDCIIRYGGDEFLIVLPETNGETHVVERRILEALDRWNERNSDLLPFPLSLAIGETHWMPGTRRLIEEALAEADQRMYEHKREHP
jgi:diguanylate cyclase (GGDEF)-like protein/PAS domain S-box-containing protein